MGLIHQTDGRYLHLKHVDIYNGNVTFFQYRTKQRFDTAKADREFFKWEQAPIYMKNQLRINEIHQIVDEICPNFYKKLHERIYQYYDKNLFDESGTFDKTVWEKDNEV